MTIIRIEYRNAVGDTAFVQLEVDEPELLVAAKAGTLVPADGEVISVERVERTGGD